VKGRKQCPSSSSLRRSARSGPPPSTSPPTGSARRAGPLSCTEDGRKGHDIADGGQLIDAKLLAPASASEKREYPGCTHKLRRDLWRPFDPARTTQVVLVEFPPDWTAGSSTSFAETTITIRHENVRLYLIEVPEFNEILAEQREQAEDEKWAFIILDDYWLTEHQVHPRTREKEASEEEAA